MNRAAERTWWMVASVMATCVPPCHRVGAGRLPLLFIVRQYSVLDFGCAARYTLGMTQTTTAARIVASCGCEFYGRNFRVIDSSACSVISPQRDTITGTQAGRHCEKARKSAESAK
jgi:hypothetical protein